MAWPLGRRRDRRSLATTIFAAFAAMGVITAALGGYGLLVLSAAGHFVADTYDISLMAVSYARSASLDFSRMEAELMRRSLVPPSERAAINGAVDKLAESFSSDLEVVAERSTTPDEQQLIKQIGALAARWRALRDVGNGVAEQRDAIGRRIIAQLDMLIEITTDHGFIARRIAMTKVGLYTYGSVAATALALLLSAGVTILLARRIMRPLAAAAAAADRIAGGQLDTPIPAGGRDETGVLLASMTVMQDNLRALVEREKAQRRSAQNRLADALESSREAIVLVDDGGRIVITNSQLTSFFPELAPRRAVGMSFTDAFGEVRDLVIVAQPQGHDADELLPAGSEVALADGRWLRVSRSPTRDGGFILLISDISDIRERELRLDEARRLAEAASEAKSAFLATMSHELRTPLNAVIGFAEILSGQLFGALGNPRYIEYAGSIQQSGRHLLGIINNVLDLSKHQAGKLELMVEPLDLVEIVESCAALMRNQCDRAGLTMTVQVPGTLTLVGDVGKLQRMLLNLLSNAIKFTKPGGNVTVSADAVGDGLARVQVSDTGIGIAPEDIPVALAVFGQVDSRLARRYDGTGLGLPLVKSIVELHGGELAIDSAPGVGTTITVWLPRITVEPQRREGAAALQRVA
jgi:signal transduction histidine kinase/HAMP domain-containing protein